MYIYEHKRSDCCQKFFALGGARETNNIDFFCPGDVLNFKQGFAMSHYAIYAGNNLIIHYQKLLGKHTVIEETVQEFRQREGDSYHVGKAKLGLVDGRMHRPFRGDEVVKRARNQVGRTSYNLVLENDEDFANWCKYGVRMSDRVEGVAVAGTGSVGFAGGAATGAIIGGAAGSIFPVVGTLIGAAVGVCIGAAAGGGVGILGSWGTSKISRKLCTDQK